MVTITSLRNPQIKKIIHLRQAKERRAQGLIIIDGAREILMAHQASLEIVTLFYCPRLIKERLGSANNFFGVDQDRIIEVNETVFHKICYKENPDGFLAVAEQPKLSLDKIKLSTSPLLVVLEAVEKPGNLGAIVRTAYAANVDLIIINDSQTDIYNPNVIRASEGLIFSQPVVLANSKETVKWLKMNKIKSFAATTNAKQSYWQANFKTAAAIVLGSEAEGLSSTWLKAADQSLRIPMRSGVDSLNVSVSAALMIFEAQRQRQK